MNRLRSVSPSLMTIRGEPRGRPSGRTLSPSSGRAATPFVGSVSCLMSWPAWSSWREPAHPSRPSAGASWTALRRARSLLPPSRVALPRSALGVALLQHAALVPGRHYVLTDQTGRKKDQPSVQVLARAAVEIELCG